MNTHKDEDKTGAQKFHKVNELSTHHMHIIDHIFYMVLLHKYDLSAMPCCMFVYSGSTICSIAGALAICKEYINFIKATM